MTGRRRREARLLLALVHPDAEVAWSALAQAGNDGPEVVRWHWIQERAEHHKVAPLAAARLLEGPTGGLPESARAWARAQRRDSEHRGSLALATLRSLAERFEERHVDFLVFKGSVLAERLYPAAWQRRFYDVDVVVRRDSLSAAEEALRSLGYEFVAPTRLFAALRVPKPAGAADAEAFVRAFSNRHHFEHHYRPSRSDLALHVDLHWRLLPPAFGAPDEVDVWRSATTRYVADTPVSTLDDETTLLHLALHAMRARPDTFRLQPIVDFAWMLERCRESTSIGTLLRRAATWRAEGHVLRALDLVAALLPTAGSPAHPRDRAVFRHRAFAPFLDPVHRLHAGAPATRAPLRRPWRRMLDGLRWHIGTADLARTLRMKAQEQTSALRYRLSARPPRPRPVPVGDPKRAR